MTPEERDMLDRLTTWLKYHSIKSLMVLVIQAIDLTGAK